MTYRDHRDWHRCGACRTRRSDGAKLFSHLLEHPECAPCTCGGYHFPHRRGTTYCHANPKSLLAEMSRGGASDADIAAMRARLVADGVQFSQPMNSPNTRRHDEPAHLR